MTVSSEISKDGPYNCNGSQVTFPFTFKVFSKSDLLVVLTDISSDVETDLVVDTDFSVSLNANQNTSPGGTITTIATYPTGQKITIVRDMQITQQVSVTNFRPDVTERVYDKITMLIQQLAEGLSRAIKVKVSNSGASPDDLIESIETSVNQAETFAQEAAASAGAAETAENNAQTFASNAQSSANAAQASADAAANSAASADINATALQQQTKTAFASAGTAPNFTVVTFPLYGAYTSKERMRIIFNAGEASGAATLNRDGLGAKGIKQYDASGAKVNAVIVSGRPYDLEYDGTDYVMLNPSSPGGQVVFPATQNPSSDPNTLDDYEEGTFTAIDASGAGLTFTPVLLSYTKVGKIVHVSGKINWPSTANAAAASVTLSGLPTSADPNVQHLSGLITASTGAKLILNGSGPFSLTPGTAALAALTNANMSSQYISLNGSYVASN